MSSDDRDSYDSDFASTLLGAQAEPSTSPPPPRSDRPGPRRRRRGWLIPLISFIIVIGLVIGGYVIVRGVVDGFTTKNYEGSGSGSVVVEVKAGDGSSDIGATLKSKGVVASTTAFVDAAKASGKSQEFEAGFFRLRLKMSGASAVTLLLDPTSRVQNKVTLAEGLILPQVLAALAKQLKLPLAQLRTAAKDISNLGLPDGYTVKNAEGFLFPQTYTFDPDVTANQALQTLTAEYALVAKQIKFSAEAAKLKGAGGKSITPYQALIVASLVEAEVKFDGDRAKVARVVYNRLTDTSGSTNGFLGFDTTSAYEAKLQGKDPTQVNYNIDTPYNTRLRKGLPPTPIDNPGKASMTAAIHPATGNWLYFVGIDKAGHLGFFDNDADFETAKIKCQQNNWGCI